MKWIRTSEMIEEIKANPDVTLEYEHRLAGPLVRTHCFIFNSERQCLYEDYGEADFDVTSFAEVIDNYQETWWRRSG